MLQELLSAVEGIDELGFLPGWGNTVGRVRESFQLLLDIVQAPDADTLEKFLSRLPLMFKVSWWRAASLFGSGMRAGGHLRGQAPSRLLPAALPCRSVSPVVVDAMEIGREHTARKGAHCCCAACLPASHTSCCAVPQVVILSPHGYFGQTNVLGMPDTGGQV